MSLTMSGQRSTCYKILNEGWMPHKDHDSPPTIDYDRYEKTVLGIEFTLFNLGGQTAFLDRFIGELSEFIFSGVVSFIFSVDALEIKKLPKAKYYFDLALKKLTQYSPSASVFLFIHKHLNEEYLI